MGRSALVKILIAVNVAVLLTLAVLLYYVFYLRPTADVATNGSAKSAGDTGGGPLVSIEDAVAAVRGKTEESGKRAAAVSSLRTLAQQGDVKAMVMMGMLSQEGVETEADLPQAFEWFQKAAAKGDADAMVKMAAYYRDGIWVDVNPAESISWLRKAKAAGSREAAWLLEETVSP